MKENTSTTIRIDDNVKRQLDGIKGDLTYNSLIEDLVEHFLNKGNE